jgi:hypothetical protein
MTDFYFIWRRDGALASNYRFPISFSGEITDAVSFTLSTSAQSLQTYETVQNVKFYLTGDPNDVNLVQELWPNLNPSGGLDVSFDGGNSWTRFSQSVGLASDPVSWLLLPQAAVGIGGLAGRLSPTETASLQVRLTIPAGNPTTKILNLELAVDCDVV